MCVVCEVASRIIEFQAPFLSSKWSIPLKALLIEDSEYLGNGP